MLRRSRLLIAGLVAVIAAPVYSQQISLQTGDKAPDVHAEKWHNSKTPVSLRRLRGKVVVIEFFESGDGKCIKDVPELVKLHEDMKENGVVVIGISPDTPERVIKFLGKYKKPYAVGSGSRSRNRYPWPKVPGYCIVDPDSKVAFLSNEIEETRKALDGVLQKTPPKPDSEMAKIFEEEAAEKMKAADKLYKDKRLPDAWDAYSAIAADYPTVPSGRKAATAAAKTRIELDESTAVLSLTRADDALKKKKFDLARKEYERIVDKWPDTPSGKKAQAQLDKMATDTSFSKDVKAAEAAKKCKGWLQTARNLAKSDRIEEAKRYYKRIIFQYPDTEYAETAKIELDKLD